MSDDPIDFSSLDPLRDPQRFEHRVLAMMAALQQSQPPVLLTSLVRWGRVAMVVAAMVAVCMWLPSLTRGVRSSPHAQRSEAAQSLSTWAESGAVPSDVDPMVALAETETETVDAE
jgi:hypothetical protein